MRIAKVEIWNFRCFAETEDGDPGLVFCPNEERNLVVGPNGSGKTALFDAIDLVLNPEGRGNPYLVSEYDFPMCDGSSRPMRIDVSLVDLGDVEPLFSGDIQWITADTHQVIDETQEPPDETKHERALVVRLEATVDPDDGELRTRWLLPKHTPTEVAEPREVRHKQHQALGYFRIHPAITRGAFTLGTRSALGRHLRKLEFRIGLVSERLMTRLRPSTCCPELCPTCPQHSVCSGIIEDVTVADVIEGIMARATHVIGEGVWEGMTAALGPRFGETRSGLSATTLGLRTVEGGGFLPFEKLSSGERLALSFSLANTRVGDVPPIILMEEPETALSSSAIGRLVSDLRGEQGTGAAAQIFATTQSESVLRQFSVEDVFLMSTEDRAPTSLKALLENAFRGQTLSRAFAFLERKLMPGEASALLAERVLIVEGEGDAIASGHLDRLAVHSDKPGLAGSFAGLGWTVFSAGGASDVPRLVKLVQALRKKAAVLFDGDDEGLRRAETTKDLCPTFAYAPSSSEPCPRLEDALLLGLPILGKARALRAFYSFSGCEGCEKKKASSRCWHEDCIRGRIAHKRELQETCLQQYRDTTSFPRAFRELLRALPMSTVGTIAFLPIDWTASS